MTVQVFEWFDFRNPDYSRVFQTRIDRLQRIRAEPQCLPYLRAYYRDNPLQYIYDWGCTHDPRNLAVGLPAIMPFLLFPRQIEFGEYILRKWKEGTAGLCDKSRDVGASWLCMALSCTLSLFHNDMVIGFGSRKEDLVDKLDDPASLFFKARGFMRLLPPEFRGSWQDKDAPFMRLIFRDSNSVITGEAGDNIGRGGRTAIYFVDEAAHLERPALIDASLSANTNCRIDLSSVKGMANPFAAKRFGGKIEPFTFHWRDDPRKDDQWYRDLSEKKGYSSVVIAQEYDIDYSASVEGVLIPSAWAQSAIDAHVKLGIEPQGAYKAAFDVADEGNDKNALAGKHGVVLNQLISWSGKGSDIFGSVATVFRTLDSWGIRNFEYDADGLGAGVRGDAKVLNQSRPEHTLRATPWRGSSAVRQPESKDVPPLKNKDFFGNLKAQEYWALRTRFQKTHRWVTEGVPCDPDDIISLDSKALDPQTLASLVVELGQPTYSVNNAGKIIVDKAPDGTKSPNLADAVMIVFAKGNPTLNINQALLGKA